MVALSGQSRIGLLAANQLPIGYGYSFDSNALAGDFNGDGKKDVVVEVHFGVWSGNELLQTMLGNGNGTFQTPQTTMMSNYGDLHVADVNGDGKDDVIVSTNAGNVDVYLSNGDGTFAAPLNFATGISGIIALAVTDLNGDHVPDLMMVDYNSQVLIALGNGNGTFQAATSVPYAGNVTTAVFADFNGDGKLDFAGIDSTGVAVYLADGSGGYQGPTYLDSDLSNFSNIAVGDLNGDGAPDLVASNGDYIANNVAIFKNSGTGTFSTGVSQWAGFATQGLTIADVNGDGNKDVIATNSYGSDITVLLANGDGTVQSPSVGFAVGSYPSSNPVVADFNADGKPDVIVPDGNFSLVYLEGYGDGTFHAAQDYYSPLPTSDTNSPWSESVASGDFNGDGTPDIVLGNCCNSEVGITVFLGKPDGSGALQPGVNYGANGMDYVAVGDFDGDGKLDVAAASNYDGLIHVFRGNGDGSFQPDVTYGDGSYYPYAIVAADLNKDGKTDLAVVDDFYGIEVLLNDGQGGFLPAVEYSLPGWSDDIAVADVNGDGFIDLLVPDNDYGTVDVLLGNGDGTFQDAQSFDAGGYPYSIAVGDANGDGKLDVFTANYDDGTISVLLGNGDGTFQNAVTYPATLQDTSNNSPGPVWIRTADVDGDGKLDLVADNENYGTVAVLYGDGYGAFSDPVEFPTGSSPWWLTTADMNGDGAPDVITANYGQIGATVLLNAGGNRIQAAASPNPAQYGDTVTLTTTITPSVRGVTSVPTGTVAFVAGTANLGTATLAAGSAALDIASLSPGTYNATASYSGDNAFRPNTALVSFVVNQAATITAVTSSANPSTLNQSVTFTAVVTPGTSGTPTGTVTFMDGTTPLGGAVALASGTATLSTTTLTAGTHSITAMYSGDANYAGSTSTALSQDVSATAPDYSLSANTTSAIVAGGQSANFQITATADGAFDGTVSFSCGQLPVGVICSFNPTAITPTNGHPATTALVVTTTSKYAALSVPASPRSGEGRTMFLASLGGIGLFGGLLMGEFSRRKLLGLAAILAVLALVMGMAGCGSDKKTNPNGTPVGQYAIDVVATATAGTTGGNTSAHHLTLTINVSN